MTPMPANPALAALMLLAFFVTHPPTMGSPRACSRTCTHPKAPHCWPCHSGSCASIVQMASDKQHLQPVQSHHSCKQSCWFVRPHQWPLSGSPDSSTLIRPPADSAASISPLREVMSVLTQPCSRFVRLNSSIDKGTRCMTNQRQLEETHHCQLPSRASVSAELAGCSRTEVTPRSFRSIDMLVLTAARGTKM